MALLPVLLDMVDEIYESLENPSNSFSDIPLLLIPQRSEKNEKSCPRMANRRRGCPRNDATAQGECSKNEVKECSKNKCGKFSPEDIRKYHEMLAKRQGEATNAEGCAKENNECPVNMQRFGPFAQFFTPEAIKQYHEMFAKNACPCKPSTTSDDDNKKREECQKNKCPMNSADSQRPSFEQYFGRPPHHHHAFGRHHRMPESCCRRMTREKCPCKPTDNFNVVIDVKSFKPEEISIKAKGREIIVEGKHEEREDEYGFVSRQFTRRYNLPDEYDPDTITSYLNADGKMTIKAIKPKPVNGNTERVIPIERVGLNEEEVEKNETSKADDDDSEKAATIAATTSDENGSQKDYVVIEDTNDGSKE